MTQHVTHGGRSYLLVAINKSHFKFHCIIGKGGFGKVIDSKSYIFRYGKWKGRSLAHSTRSKKCQRSKSLIRNR